MKQKNTSTQLLVFGLILISSSVLLWPSCAETWSVWFDNTKYAYYNNSGHQVTITSFNYGIDSTYILYQGDSLIIYEELSTGSTYNNFLICDSDSVRIWFDNSKQWRFNKESTSNRNPIFLSNYEYVRIVNDAGYLQFNWFEYYFTPDDFENAEPLITAP